MDWLFGGSKATQASVPDTKLRIQTAVAGKPIPIGCGQDRFAANLIWYGDFQSQSQSVGGKGGGRPDMAEAGGKDVAALDSALATVKADIESKL